MRRRRASSTAPVVVEHVDMIRTRLHVLFDGAFRDPRFLAGTDQLSGALRERFDECGVELADPATRAALLVFADTVSASLTPLAAVCTTSVRMWGITAQIAAAVLTIDDHEQGARP